MIVKTQAIVLHKIKYSDTGIIVNLYTEKIGRVAVMVRGGRTRKSSRSVTLFSLLNILDIELDYKNRREIQIIREASLHKSFNHMQLEPEKSAMAYFIAEVLGKCLQEEESVPDLFNYIVQNVIEFENLNEKYYNFHLAFLIHLIGFLGFNPSGEFSEDTPFLNIREGLFLPFYTIENESFDIPQSEAFSQFLSRNPNLSGEVIISNSCRRQLIQKIVDYLSFHIYGFGKLKSLPVLHEVFAS